MTYRGIISVAVLALFVSACAAGPHVPGAVRDANGNYVFEATGTSAIVGESPNALIRAHVAAQTLAKANLVERIRGQLLRGKTVVSNLQFEEQWRVSVIEGWIHGVTFRQAHYDEDDGTYMVKATVVMSGDELQNLERRLDSIFALGAHYNKESK